MGLRCKWLFILMNYLICLIVNTCNDLFAQITVIQLKPQDGALATSPAGKTA